MVSVKGVSLAAAITAGCVGILAAEEPPQDQAIVGLGGLTFGDSWRGMDALLPAAWHGGEGSAERVFYLADAAQRHTLGGVQLDWPGLLYRFVDDRLYAIEGEFSGSEQAFTRLQSFLSARHGAPSVSQSWRTAPEETYVYRARLRSVAWYSADAQRSIWLMQDEQRGYLLALDRDGASGLAPPPGDTARSGPGGAAPAEVATAGE